MLRWHQNLISFEGLLERDFFRPKRRQDAKTLQIAAQDRVGPCPVGQDLGEGRQTFRLPEPLSQELGPRRWDLEGQEDLDRVIQHADPVGRLGRLLVNSWVALGHLGANLEPSWAPRGTKSTPRPSKIEARTAQDSLDM